MLFLSEEEVKDLLNINDYIQWVEEAYQADGLGEAFMFPRQNLKLPEGHSYKILSGALPFAGGDRSSMAEGPCTGGRLKN